MVTIPIKTSYIFNIQENDTTGNQYDYIDSGSYYFTINPSTNLQQHTMKNIIRIIP
ncbi:MAG: hypothetical protein WDM78_02855 [Puia sp.]